MSSTVVLFTWASIFAYNPRTTAIVKVKAGKKTNQSYDVLQNYSEHIPSYKET